MLRYCQRKITQQTCQSTVQQWGTYKVSRELVYILREYILGWACAVISNIKIVRICFLLGFFFRLGSVGFDYNGYFEKSFLLMGMCGVGGTLFLNSDQISLYSKKQTVVDKFDKMSLISNVGHLCASRRPLIVQMKYYLARTTYYLVIMT